MRQVRRRITRNRVWSYIYGYAAGQSMAIAAERAKEYNEIWYAVPNEGVAFNEKGRDGLEQHRALGYRPDGSVFILEAAPRGA